MALKFRRLIKIRKAIIKEIKITIRNLDISYTQIKAYFDFLKYVLYERLDKKGYDLGVKFHLILMV